MSVVGFTAFAFLATLAVMDGEFIRSSQVGRLFGVSDDTIRRWVALGILPARRLPSGHLRFDPEAVERLRLVVDAETEAVAS